MSESKLTWRSWIGISGVIFAPAVTGYLYRFILLKDGSVALSYVLCFEVGLALFCIGAGLMIVPKSRWLMLKSKLRGLYNRKSDNIEQSHVYPYNLKLKSN